MRRADTIGLQEGAVEATAYKVIQRGAGANMSVDIQSDTGSCLVQGDSATGQALYLVPQHSAVINEVVTAADATNPRIDQVILEVKDNTHDASGSNLVQTRVVAGTPTVGATLANRTGVAALPNSAMRLADILVPALSTSVVTANIRDRRQWARGAYARIVRNANAAAGNDYTTTSATLADIDATNLALRLECSGVPLRLSLRGRATHTVAANYMGFSFTSDGAYFDGATSAQAHYAAATGGANVDIPLHAAWDAVGVVAGSHLLKPQFNAQAATGTLRAQAAIPLIFAVEEIVRGNTNNGTS